MTGTSQKNMFALGSSRLISESTARIASSDPTV
jgi:hypothetical protein